MYVKQTWLILKFYFSILTDTVLTVYLWQPIKLHMSNLLIFAVVSLKQFHVYLQMRDQDDKKTPNTKQTKTLWEEGKRSLSWEISE